MYTYFFSAYIYWRTVQLPNGSTAISYKMWRSPLISIQRFWRWVFIYLALLSFVKRSSIWHMGIGSEAFQSYNVQYVDLANLLVSLFLKLANRKIQGTWLHVRLVNIRPSSNIWVRITNFTRWSTLPAWGKLSSCNTSFLAFKLQMELFQEQESISKVLTKDPTNQVKSLHQINFQSCL